MPVNFWWREVMLDIPALHGMEFQEEQFAFREGSDSCSEQAQTHQGLQLYGSVFLVVQNAGELRWEWGQEEADGVEDFALFRCETPDAVVQTCVEGRLALRVF